MKKKIAIVGYGGMGGWHCGQIKANGVLDLVGIYDIKEERRKAAEADGLHAYATLDELLADEQIDLITIATPNDFHKEIAIKALSCGKNVISEKPVALNSEELSEMIEAAHKYGKIFTVHQNRRWDGGLATMKEVFESGMLGKVYSIEFRIHGSRGIPGDWRCLKKHGGGMMFDWGVHLIDEVLQLVDSKVKKIYCKLDHVTNDEVDDGFKLDLMFENGINCRLEVGTNNFIELPQWYVLGEDGTLIITDWERNGKIVNCSLYNESGVTPIKAGAGLTKTMAPRNENTIKEHPLPLPTPDVHDFYRNVCAAIDGKEEQIVKHHELMRVMKIMETAMKSDELCQVVDFDDNF